MQYAQRDGRPNEFQIQALDAIDGFAARSPLSLQPIQRDNGIEYRLRGKTTLFTVYHNRLDEENAGYIEIALGDRNIAHQLDRQVSDVQDWIGHITQDHFHPATPKPPQKWPRLSLWSIDEVRQFKAEFREFYGSGPVPADDETDAQSAIVSKYIAGEDVPPYDHMVSSALADYGIEGGGKDKKIAIENLEQQVYRTITTSGLDAYMHVVEALSELGMQDLLQSSPPRGGFDSWFVPTPGMVRAAPPANARDDDPFADVEAEEDALRTLPATARRAIVLSRVGQGVFRSQLINYWKCCAVTGAGYQRLLRASHIKPWRSATNHERLDLFNGLLLAPNLDAAFDAGYISFDTNGRIMLSQAIIGAPAYQMHINSKMRINSKLLCAEHQAYLDHHRTDVFKG